MCVVLRELKKHRMTSLKLPFLSLTVVGLSLNGLPGFVDLQIPFDYFFLKIYEKRKSVDYVNNKLNTY